MKKLTAFLLSIVSILALVACGPNTDATIALVNTTSETIIIDVTVSDPKQDLVADSLVAKAFLDGAQKAEQKIYEEVDGKDNTFRFRVNGLTHDTTYVIKVYGTVSDQQIEFDSKSYKTKAEGATTTDPIAISTTEEFLDIKDSPTSYFALQADIDFNHATIKAEDFFGTSSSSSAFRGNLDGGGYTVKNLNLISTTKPQYLGLFGYINGDANRKEASIKDLTLDNVNIISTIYYSTVHAGVLAGRVSNTSRLENVKVINSRIQLELKGNSATSSNIGGAIGHLEGQANSIVTDNVDIDVILGGVNSVNVGGAIGYVYHSSNPKTLEKVSSDGNITFSGLISSTQARAVVVNIGGAIGDFNIHKQASEIGSNVNIKVLNFKYIGREGAVTNEFRRVSDTLRVGGLIGEFSSNYQINKGFYSGSIAVDSFDEYGRIEEVIVAALIAKANDGLNTANLARLGLGKTIVVNTQAKNSPAIVVADNNALGSGSNVINDTNLVYGASKVVVNGIDNAPSNITVGDGINELNSEFLLSASASKGININHLSAYAHKVAFDVAVSDIRNEYNLDNIEVALYDGNTKVNGVPIKAFSGSFAGLTINKDYQVKVLDNGVSVAEKAFKTINVGISYTDEVRGLNKLKFNINLADADSLVKADTLVATIYENGSQLKRSTVGATSVSFDGLKAGVNYYIKVSATIDDVEEVVIDAFNMMTSPLVNVNLADPVLLTATTITFKVSLVEDDATLIDYTSLEAKIYQNNTEVEAKEFTNNPANGAEIKFENLTADTVYYVVITATVDGSNDVIVGLVGDATYQTAKITAKITESSLTIVSATTANTVDMSFKVTVNDISSEATDIKVELWYNGKLEKTPVDYVDEDTLITFTNLREGAVISIKITASINGVTVVIGEEAVSLSVN